MVFLSGWIGTLVTVLQFLLLMLCVQCKYTGRRSVSSLAAVPACYVYSVIILEDDLFPHCLQFLLVSCTV